MSTNYKLEVFEKNVKEDVEESRTIEFIINADVKDRHKDILNYDKWELDDFNRNPVVGYQHNIYGDNMCTPPNPDDVLGKAINTHVDSYKGKRVLLSSVVFEPKAINENAEKVFRKVLFGSLNAASVGILPTGKINTEYVKNERGEIIDQTNYWPGQKLLEWSIVNIPANQEAVRRSLKNHTRAGIDFVARLLPDFSIKDIRQMKVQEVLDLLEKKHITDEIETIEEVLNKPDADLAKYQDRLKRLSR